MLRPEVAARFALTSHTTCLHVVRLGRDVDLTQVSLEEAEELVSLPGGFEWLKRVEVPSEVAPAARKKTRPAATTAGLRRAKKKKGG